ncbi:MAG: exodeoxyribonuclease VII small subunit [Ignavibacteria bacterium]|jgi:exodeoxyribonuclease VII small subunit|nr:exodeoxyribonuclease VII small subunit [Ignavibacteria bacterium]
MNSFENDSFEKQLKELENIVEKLDESDVPLEESLKLYEDAMAMYKVLNKKIAEAEQKIIDISKINNLENSEKIEMEDEI